MTRGEIVEALAREGKVQTLVCNIAHSPLTQDLQDLCQMVYLFLLEYDEDKIVDLWESDALGYFIARIVCNQFRTNKSAFRRAIRPAGIHGHAQQIESILALSEQ